MSGPKVNFSHRNIWAVHKDRIYTSWTECEKAVAGFEDMPFKRFKATRRKEAEQYVREGPAPSEEEDGWIVYQEIPGSDVEDALFVMAEGCKGKDEQERVRYGMEGWFGDKDQRNFSRPFALHNPTVNRTTLCTVVRVLEIIRDTEPAARALVLCMKTPYVSNAIAKNPGAKTINRGLIRLLRGHIEQHHASRSIVFSLDSTTGA